MRGLIMALFAIDFPGHGGSRPAGREAMPVRSRTTKTKATITKTTAKTV